MRPQIHFHFKLPNKTNQYELYLYNCYNASKNRKGINFHASYAPISSIKSLWIIIGIYAA